jgi:hypothetical protein
MSSLAHSVSGPYTETHFALTLSSSSDSLGSFLSNKRSVILRFSKTAQRECNMLSLHAEVVSTLLFILQALMRESHASLSAFKQFPKACQEVELNVLDVVEFYFLDLFLITYYFRYLPFLELIVFVASSSVNFIST